MKLDSARFFFSNLFQKLRQKNQEKPTNHLINSS